MLCVIVPVFKARRSCFKTCGKEVTAFCAVTAPSWACWLKLPLADGDSYVLEIKIPLTIFASDRMTM